MFGEYIYANIYVCICTDTCVRMYRFCIDIFCFYLFCIFIFSNYLIFLFFPFFSICTYALMSMYTSTCVYACPCAYNIPMYAYAGRCLCMCVCMRAPIMH